MLQNQLSVLLSSIPPLSFGTCVPSTEDALCSTVHIWCVLALFLIGLQYNHLIKLTAKIKTQGSSLGKLNGSKLGSKTYPLKTAALISATQSWAEAECMSPSLFCLICVCVHRPRVSEDLLHLCLAEWCSASYLPFSQFTLHPNICWCLSPLCSLSWILT